MLYQAQFKTGVNPVYAGAVPTVADTDNYSYGDCIGWSTTLHDDNYEVAYGATFPAIGNEDVEYYAIHPVTEKKYDVTWLDNDGQVIMEQTGLWYNEIDPDACTDIPEIEPVYSGTLNSQSDAYKFTEYHGKAVKTVSNFTGWSGDYNMDEETGIGTCVFTASYSVVDQNLVLFLNEAQDTVLSAQYYPINAKIKPAEVYAGVTPTKASDDTYQYTTADGRVYTEQIIR